MKKIWFRRKQYGWGWTPITWQGWLILAVYVIAMFFIVRTIDMRAHSDSDALISLAMPFIILTTILIVICRLTGETPRWQWGSDESDPK